MLVPLTIQYHCEPLRDATAWYMPSGSVAEWVDVICAVGWDQSTLRIVPIASSNANHTLHGALFYNTKETTNNSDLPTHTYDSRLQPYGELTKNLFIPT